MKRLFFLSAARIRYSPTRIASAPVLRSAAASSGEETPLSATKTVPFGVPFRSFARVSEVDCKVLEVSVVDADEPRRLPVPRTASPARRAFPPKRSCRVCHKCRCNRVSFRCQQRADEQDCIRTEHLCLIDLVLVHCKILADHWTGDDLSNLLKDLVRAEEPVRLGQTGKRSPHRRPHSCARWLQS